MLTFSIVYPCLRRRI